MSESAAVTLAASQRFAALHRLIGNTPLLAIDFLYKREPRVIYAKQESLNFTGSIKDRMALFVLERAYRTGAIARGSRIAEATSGNTGISFSAVGRALGHPVTIFMPDWMSIERISLIASFGATIVPVSRADGGFLGSIKRSEELAAGDSTVFLPRQFSNEANVEAHYRTTGPEIWSQLAGAGITPDAFVAGVGTGGTVMGVGRFLKQRNPVIRVHPLEPAESPTMSIGHKVGQHRIQGISDEFVPDIVKLDELDAIVQAADGDSILMAQALAQHGLAVGISSGANFIGALQAQNQIGASAAVVTVFSDSNKKYLSTDLLKPEPVKLGYFSPDVEIVGFRALPRVCAMCFDAPQG